MDHPPDNKPPEIPHVEEGLSSRTWEARRALPFPKDYFALQLEFAKELSKKWSKPLRDVLLETSPIFKGYTFIYERTTGSQLDTTSNDFLDFVYNEYIEEETLLASIPVSYHEKGSSRFGCFSYTADIERGKEVIRIHFTNAEFDTTGPLSQTKSEKRRSEIKDLLKEIKLHFPNASEIAGLSWLYHSLAYKRFFPASYLKGLKVNTDQRHWKRGTIIWGQFLDSELNVKRDLAVELLARVRALPADGQLSDLFAGDTKLMPPLETSAPIEDFYTMYGIK